jgi:hypothetical protein
MPRLLLGWSIHLSREPTGDRSHFPLELVRLVGAFHQLQSQQPAVYLVQAIQAIQAMQYHQTPQIA